MREKILPSENGWVVESKQVSFVSQVRKASTNEELVNLKLNNINSMHDWMDFVKDKTQVQNFRYVICI